MVVRLVRALAATSAAVLVTAAACTDLSGLSGGTEPFLIDADLPGPDPEPEPGPQPGGGDASTEPRCDPSKPFGAPEPMTAFERDYSSVKGAFATPDELEVFYLGFVPGGGEWELRHARREARDAPWGESEVVPLDPTPDGFLSINGSGLKLYFWEFDTHYSATRGALGEPFTGQKPFGEPRANWTFVGAAEEEAYFAVYEGGSGNNKVIKRAPVLGDELGDASTVPNIHVAPSNDDRPVLNLSETALYFASNRDGGVGLADVWVARRASREEPFGEPVHVPELSSDRPDHVSWVSDDDCEIFLDRASKILFARRGR